MPRLARLTSLTVLFLVAAFAAQARAACEPLLPGMYVPHTGDYAMADFDGDGDDDFARAGQDWIYLVRNDGGYRFTTHKYPWQPGGGRATAESDVDGDGDIDLVVGSYHHDGVQAVSILLNSGEGEFAVSSSHAVAGYGRRVALGDLTGDGLPDIVTSGVEDQLCVLINTGAGEFVSGECVPADWHLREITIADFDGDGLSDIGAVCHTYDNNDYNARIYLNCGNAYFGDPIGIGRHPDYTMSMVAFDADRDGDTDVALASELFDVLVFENNGGAVFAEPQVYDGSFGWSSLAAGDLNGDGYLDLIDASDVSDWFSGGVTLLLNSGDGNFGATETIRTPFSGERLLVMDADDDGDADLFVPVERYHHRSTQLLLNNGKATYLAPVIYETDPEVDLRLATGDLNGDGGPDLVGAGLQDGVLSVWINDGNGGLASDGSYQTAIPMPTRIELLDLNSDGWIDVLLFQEKWDIAYVGALLNNGDGTLTASDPFELGTGVRQFAVGDLDDDGCADVVAIDWLGEMIQMRNNGDGTFAIHSTQHVGDVRSPSMADINADGLEDLVLKSYNYPGGVAIMRRVGPFEFASAAHVQSPGDVLSLADIDGDGDVDIFTTGGSSDGDPVVATLLNQGDGTFDSPILSVVEAEVWEPHLVDLDDDGVLDLIGTDDKNQLCVYRSSIPGRFGLVRYYNAALYCSSATADFDGDGLTDVAVANRGDGWMERNQVSLFFNQHRPPCLGDLNGDCDADQRDLGLLLASYERDAGGDLDGDGDTDQDDLTLLLGDYGCK
jgi:hypothetical protein